MPHSLFIPDCFLKFFHQIMSSLAVSATHSSTSSFLPINNHPQYYLPGGDLYIITKAIRFHVHKYFFKRESAHFRTIFEITPLVGSSPDFALDLSHEIKPDEFELFLSVMYNLKYNIYNLSMGQWFNIQIYAGIWQFPEMYSLTEQEIEKIRIKEMNDPVANEMLQAYMIRQDERYHWLLNRIYEGGSKWDQGSQPSAGVMLCCLSLGVRLTISLSLPYSCLIVLSLPRITLWFHLSQIPWSPCDPYASPLPRVLLSSLLLISSISYSSYPVYITNPFPYVLLILVLLILLCLLIYPLPWLLLISNPCP